ncbi:MAG: hypothetical protein IPM39_25890 [Chloroflexi bacterium]|nr:hypothetical protein [Chloroflexota bacterium]
MMYQKLVDRLVEIGSVAFRAETEGLREGVEAAYAKMQAVASTDDRLALMTEAGQLEEAMNIRFELLDRVA